MLYTLEDHLEAVPVIASFSKDGNVMYETLSNTEALHVTYF